MSDRKTALMDMAEGAIRSRGIDAFSFGDLAKDAGIKTASIHYHFPTKGHLSFALMHRYAQQFSDVCAEIDARHRSGAARLRALVDRYRMAHRYGTQLCLCVALSLSRESLAEDVLHEMTTFRRAMRDWIAAAFDLGRSDTTIVGAGAAQAEAAAMLSLLEGAQLAARAEQDPLVFDRAVALLEKRFG